MHAFVSTTGAAPFLPQFAMTSDLYMRINWSNLLTVGSATILVGSQTVALGILTGWATAGLLGLGDIGAYAFEAAFGGLALAGTIAFTRMAMRAEPLTDQDETQPPEEEQQQEKDVPPQ